MSNNLVGQFINMASDNDFYFSLYAHSKTLSDSELTRLAFKLEGLARMIRTESNVRFEHYKAKFNLGDTVRIVTKNTDCIAQVEHVGRNGYGVPNYVFAITRNGDVMSRLHGVTDFDTEYELTLIKGASDE